jgi:hypothetical protein
MSKPYFELWLDRAWRDGATFTREHIKSTAVLVAASVLGIPAFAIFAKHVDVMREFVQIIAYGLIGPVFLLLGWFLFQLIMSPSRLHADALAGVETKPDKEERWLRRWTATILLIFLAAIIFIFLVLFWKQSDEFMNEGANSRLLSGEIHGRDGLVERLSSADSQIISLKRQLAIPVTVRSLAQVPTPPPALVAGAPKVIVRPPLLPSATPPSFPLLASPQEPERPSLTPAERMGFAEASDALNDSLDQAANRIEADSQDLPFHVISVHGPYKAIPSSLDLSKGIGKVTDMIKQIDHLHEIIFDQLYMKNRNHVFSDRLRSIVTEDDFEKNAASLRGYADEVNTEIFQAEQTEPEHIQAISSVTLPLFVKFRDSAEAFKHWAAARESTTNEVRKSF